MKDWAGPEEIHSQQLCGKENQYLYAHTLPWIWYTHSLASMSSRVSYSSQYNFPIKWIALAAWLAVFGLCDPFCPDLDETLFFSGEVEVSGGAVTWRWSGVTSVARCSFKPGSPVVLRLSELASSLFVPPTCDLINLPFGLHGGIFTGLSRGVGLPWGDIRFIGDLAYE